jgi:hypothetical protein
MDRRAVRSCVGFSVPLIIRSTTAFCYIAFPFLFPNIGRRPPGCPYLCYFLYTNDVRRTEIAVEGMRCYARMHLSLYVFTGSVRLSVSRQEEVIVEHEGLGDAVSVYGAFTEAGPLQKQVVCNW